MVGSTDENGKDRSRKGKALVALSSQLILAWTTHVVSLSNIVIY